MRHHPAEHFVLPARQLEDPSEVDTLKGTGRRDCPSMSECQLAFLQALNARDLRWDERIQGIEEQVSEVRSILLQWVGSKGIRNSDSTPPARGTLNVEAGPVKVRGRTWVIAAVLLLLGAMGAGSYVLAAWGRPTTTIRAK
jgi:UDP-N-acetylglucosamine:LPS N-acetylglucosamine transferase